MILFVSIFPIPDHSVRFMVFELPNENLICILVLSKTMLQIKFVLSLIAVTISHHIFALSVKHSLQVITHIVFFFVFSAIEVPLSISIELSKIKLSLVYMNELFICLVMNHSSKAFSVTTCEPAVVLLKKCVVKI